MQLVFTFIYKVKDKLLFQFSEWQIEQLFINQFSRSWIPDENKCYYSYIYILTDILT